MRRALAAVAACTALLCAAPAWAGVASPLPIGLQDDPVFVGPPTGHGTISATEGYARAAQLGVSIIRIGIRWSTVEHRPGRFTWKPYDAAIAAARAHGFRVQVALTGPAPAFATADRRVGVLWPSAPAFAAFAAAAAARYGATVDTYSIWNEPNWWDLLRPDRDAPMIYRRLYQAAYSAIKRTDPGARVLIGELAPMGYPEAAMPPLKFIREMTCRNGALRPLRRCAPLLADGFALHPYTLRWTPRFGGYSRDDVTTGSLARLVSYLDRLARAHALSDPKGHPLDIYLTEYGWHVHYRPIPELVRARFAVEGFELASRSPRVRELVWYQLAAPTGGGGWDTALLDNEGRATPTFVALSAWVSVSRPTA